MVASLLCNNCSELCPNIAQKNDKTNVPLSHGGKESIPRSHEGKEMAIVANKKIMITRASAFSRYKTNLNCQQPNVKKRTEKLGEQQAPLALVPNFPPIGSALRRTMNLHPLKTSVFHQTTDQALFNIDPVSGS